MKLLLTIQIICDTLRRGEGSQQCHQMIHGGGKGSAIVSRDFLGIHFKDKITLQKA